MEVERKMRGNLKTRRDQGEKANKTTHQKI
jgi:hypothetical protein